MLSKQDVEHIAKLARIELNEQEKKKYQEQLGKVLDYFDKLKQVKTDGIETADGGTRGLENVWREDESRTQDSINKTQGKSLIDMAPDKKDGQIKVRSVF